MADEEQGSGSSGSDPAGISLALAGASREEADAYLRDQRHHLNEQLKEIGLKLWELRLGVLLRIATTFAGLAVVAGIVFLIWSAWRSNDLVIDSFQMPPDLAARGLSGPVMAAKLSDKIAKMQAETYSQRAPKSYANGISDGLKIEIPETGVSLFELDRFLRMKIGHDIHIGGEAVVIANDIALTARVGTNGSDTIIGTEAGINELLQKVAEHIYHITQPYRFAVWLQAQGRANEGIAILKQLAAKGPKNERAWAYNGWGVTAAQAQGDRVGLGLLKIGHELDPNNYLILQNLAVGEQRLGHEEDSASYHKAAKAALLAHGDNYTLDERIRPMSQFFEANILLHKGALLEASELQRPFLDDPTNINTPSYPRLAAMQVALHEPTKARVTLARSIPNTNVTNLGLFELENLTSHLSAAAEAQDWGSVLSSERDFVALSKRYPGFADDKTSIIDPLLAVALAHTGHFSEARARLNAMPEDCYRCLRARGYVAALLGQEPQAEQWFASAVAIAPTAPYANCEWGKVLLAHHKPDDAIYHFIAANRIGPHFADPLEVWGEALMAKNQSHLALAKFKEADKYAPNWGRLHLKWGEALVWAGKKEDAKAQFARAAQLDLTPSEKSELARHP